MFYLLFTTLLSFTFSEPIQNITFYHEPSVQATRRMAYGTYDRSLFMVGGILGNDETNNPKEDIFSYNMASYSMQRQAATAPFPFELRFVSDQCQIGDYIYYLPTSCSTEFSCHYCYTEDCSVWRMHLKDLSFTKLAAALPAATADLEHGIVRGSLCGFISSIDGLPYLFHVGGQTNEWQGVGVRHTYLYNETALNWMVMSDLVIPVSEATCVGYNDHLYLFSGRQTTQIQIFDFNNNQWSVSTQSMDIPVMNVMPLLIDAYDMILLFGGDVAVDSLYSNYREESLDWIQIYHINNDTLIRSVETLPLNTSSAAISYDYETGLIYLIGGQSGTLIPLNVVQIGCIRCNEGYIANVLPGELTGNVAVSSISFQLQSGNLMPQNVSSMAYGTYNEKFYMIGGVYAGDLPPQNPNNLCLSDNVIVFDLLTNEFVISEEKAPIPFELQSSSYYQIDDYLYYSPRKCTFECGTNGDRPFWRFNFRDLSFEKLENVPSGWGFSTMCGITSSVDNLPYIFSIAGVAPGWQPVYDNNLYNVANQSWSNKRDIPVHMLQSVCVGVGDTLYMFGGVTTNLIVRYDFISDEWTSSRQTITDLAGNAIHLMQMHASVIPQLSYILLFGGTDYNNAYVSDVIRVYDYENDIIVNLNSTMPYPQTLGAITFDAVTNIIYSFGGVKINIDHGGIPTNQWSKGWVVFGDNLTNPTTLTPTTLGPTTPIDWGVTAFFSDSFLEIFIDLTNNNDNNDLLVYGNADQCDEIFSVSRPNNALRGATCLFTNKIKNIDIIISLSSASTIMPEMELILNSESFHYLRVEDNFQIRHAVLNDLAFYPATAINPVQPLISLNFASVIGSCDVANIDARSTSNLGARSANFTWKVLHSYPNNTNNDLLSTPTLLTGLDENILSNLNIDTLSTLEIELIIESWFGQKSSQIFNISKANNALPILILTASPNIFAQSNHNYDQIALTSFITFNSSCINDDDVIPFLSYSLKWSVSSTTTSELNALQNYLNQLQDADNIFIPSAYMSPGNIYTFELELDCIDSGCLSPSRSSVSVDYVYSNIQCQIGSSNTLFLNDVSINQMQSFQLSLDGETFTFDYDQPSIANKTNLLWTWSCTHKYDAVITSCDDLFVGSDSVQTLSFENEQFIADSTYIYEVEMTVSDANIPSRMECSDSVTLFANIIANTDTLDAINILSVSIAAAVSQEINSNERLRLIVDVTNWNELEDGEQSTVSYVWSETSDSAMDKLNDINQNIENNGNLILPANTLSAGNIYEFVLFVVQHSNNDHTVIAHGSASIDITVNRGPVIVSNSFTIDPQCNNTKYNSLNDAFTTFYDLSIDADSDYLPLSYLFSYSYDIDDDLKYVFTPSLLSQSFIKNTLLPIGEFHAFGAVFDSASTKVEYSTKCDISLTTSTNNECILFSDILSNYLDGGYIESSNDILLFLLQSAQIYTDFVLKNDYYYDDNTECIESMIDEIIITLYDYMIEDVDVCNTDYSVTLSQILSSLVLLQEQYQYFEDTNNAKMFELLHIAFDPCQIIENIKDLDDLSLSTDSIISNIAALYYKEDNIISFIPYIIRNFDVSISSLFYSFVSSSITFSDQLQFNDKKLAKKLFNLVYASLYIHTLLQISNSIPGEELNIYEFGVSIFTVRVSADLDTSLNISILDVDIEFDSNLFKNDKCKQQTTNHKLCGIDIITLPLNITNKQIKITKSNICDQEKTLTIINSTLSDSDAVSIQMVGSDFNVSSLPSNISITFDFNGMLDIDLNELRCAWFDPINNVWSYEGCTQYIDLSSRSIHCSCNHLTIFGTVHDIHDANNISCDLFNDEKWRNAHLVFFILFLMLFCYVFIQILPFVLKYKRKHKNKNIFLKHFQLFVLVFILIIALFNMVVCFMLFLTKIKWNGSNVSLLTFFMLIPLIFYFMMFSWIFFSWTTVANSMKPNAYYITKHIRRALIVANICYFLLFIAEVIILSLRLNNQFIYLLCEIIWCFLMFFSVLLFSYYGYKMVKIIYDTAKTMEEEHAPSKQSRSRSRSRSRSSSKQQLPNLSHIGVKVEVARKLSFIAIIIVLFFCIQFILTVFYVSKQLNKVTLEWRIIDISSHLICLSTICFMYRKNMKKLRKELNIKPLCCFGAFERIRKYSVTATAANIVIESNGDSPRPGSPVPLCPATPISIQDVHSYDIELNRDNYVD